MRDFLRALKFAWPYRTRITLSVVFALLAAAFWSLNFTAVYPVLKILSTGQNLQEWVNTSIDKIEKEQIAPLEKELRKLHEGQEKLAEVPAGPQKIKLERNLAGHQAKVVSQLETARSELHRLHQAKKYIDQYCPEDPFQTLALVLALVVIGVAVKGVFEFWQESLVGSVVMLSLYDLRNRFFRKSLQLDQTNFTEAGTHELMSRFTNDMEQLANGQRTVLGKVVAEPLKAVGCIAIACWISWQLTLLFLVLVPVAVFILTRIGRVMKRATRRVLERMSNIYKILQEVFLGIRIIKAFVREPRERRRFRQATRDYYHKAMWVINLDALAGPIIEMLGVAGVCGALLAGAYLVISRGTHFEFLGFSIRMTDQPLEAESLLTLYAFLVAVADPVRKLSSVFTRIQSSCAAADRIFAYLDRVPKIRPNSTGPVLARHHREIEFRNVCFSYDPSKPLLTGVHLTVPHGETIAIVGKNGCGKSTLLSLLPRFYDPDHGSILIDGIDIRMANLRSLRKQIAVVTQETILFDDTIYNNIGYGKPNATREEIEEAARQARAHDFIVTKLKHGYDTRAGEAGTKLSGGEKQRICLARAFLINPSILILDEFTSQADAETEVEVHRILREFMRGRTTFVITHRLNTLEIADRIIVLDEGRVAACGTHVELLRTCPLYLRLHEAQTRRLVA